MKKLIYLLGAAVLTASLLVGCGSSNKGESDTPATTPEVQTEDDSQASADDTPTDETSSSSDFSIAMVTDVGGVNDESFNQSAWLGMETLKEKLGIDVSFIESQKDADYAPNLEKKVDENPDIIWGIGYLMKDAMREAAESNPDQLFALVDDTFEEGEVPNIICVMFLAEQSSFEVGYAAAHMTETDHVGFIVGMESPTMDRFKYGYMAGVEYAAKELGKTIKIDTGVVESFSDSAKGKAMAQVMYTDGADVIFQAAGQAGTGCIEAAKEMNKMVIGVDLDQNKLAPDNVITSGLKNVNVAVYEITERVMNGEELGGKVINMGLAEGGVGIAPSSDKLIPAEVLDKVKEAEQKIIDGEINVPITDEEYKAFVKGL